MSGVRSGTARSACLVVGFVLWGCGNSAASGVGESEAGGIGTHSASGSGGSGRTTSEDAAGAGTSGGPTPDDGSAGGDGSMGTPSDEDAVADGHASDGADVALRASDCFPAPGACGYPDPNYGTVGVPATTMLTASGSITVSAAGTLVQNLDVTGTITISASNTTIQNVRLSVTANGSGVAGISIENGATGTSIQDSTIVGGGTTDSPESAIFNHYAEPLTLTRVYLYNFADPVEGPATITDSYINANGTYGSGSNVAHIEDVYVSDGTVSVNHSVLLNPSGQTATVFMDTSGTSSQIAGDDHIVVTNSLLAGGGWTLYPSAKSTTVGTGTMNVSNNRFARCLSTPMFDGSGTTCASGADTHGYFPNCGYYGVAANPYCPPTSGQMWSGNVWDDDGSALDCP
jgi:hypothetical protein